MLKLILSSSFAELRSTTSCVDALVDMKAYSSWGVQGQVGGTEVTEARWEAGSQWEDCERGAQGRADQTKPRAKLLTSDAPNGSGALKGLCCMGDALLGDWTGPCCMHDAVHGH